MLNTDFYLFVYDIHEPKILRQVVKRLNLINSMRIQKSVFEVQGEVKEINSLISDVSEIINNQTDRIAVVPLCKEDYEKVEFIGQLPRRPKVVPEYYIL